LLAYVCGAQSTLAIDLEPIFDIESVAISLAATAFAILLGRFDRSLALLGVDIQAARRRLGDLNLPNLLAGDLSSLPDAIKVRHTHYQKLGVSEAAFDLMVSNSVFEHLSDLPGTLSELKKSMSVDARLSYRNGL